MAIIPTPITAIWPTRTVKEDDISVFRRVQFVGPGGEPVDLSSASSVTITITNSADTNLVTAGAGTIDDAVEGRVRYQPVAAAVATVGRYFVSWTINWGATTSIVPTIGRDYLVVTESNVP